MTGGARDGADGRGLCFSERFGAPFAALGSQPAGVRRRDKTSDRSRFWSSFFLWSRFDGF